MNRFKGVLKVSPYLLIESPLLENIGFKSMSFRNIHIGKVYTSEPKKSIIYINSRNMSGYRIGLPYFHQIVVKS